MGITWVATEGTQAERPSALDMTSSPTTVYLRRNIRREQKEDSQVWAYDEAALTHAQYQEYAHESLGSFPDMDGAIIDQYEVQVSQDAAILELYEMIEGR